MAGLTIVTTHAGPTPLRRTVTRRWATYCRKLSMQAGLSALWDRVVKLVPDVIHELVHSLRRISGKMHRFSLWGTGTLSSQGNNEEFIAIMVTNIFISDVTNTYKTGLRDDWLSHSPLDPALAESYRFFALGTKAFNLIATFCDDNPGFTQMLSKVRAHFNPIAAYYKNRRKAFEIAANGDSENVFAHLPPPDYYQNEKGMWTRLVPFPSPSARK